MSLRTKLLAATVCVPVAVLLIALWIMIRFENRVDASIGAAGRITALARVASWTEFGRALLDEVKAGHFSEAYLMRWELPDRSYSSKDYWTAAHYFAPTTTRTTVPDIWTDEIEDDDDPQANEPAVTETPPLRDFIHASIANPAGEQFVLAEGYLTMYPRALTRGRRFAVLVRLTNWRMAAQIYWIMVAGALLTVVVGGWMLTRLVTRPLASLAKTADAIAAGRPVARDPPASHPDEVGRTTEALHRMAQEIEEYQGHLEDRVMTALKRVRNAEQHLTIAQRLAATGTLTAGLAHEINNPLGGMKNAVRALSRGDLSEEQSELYLELVTDGLQRIEQMVKKFVSFSPRRVEPRAVDLVEVLTRAMALTAHRLQQHDIQLEHRLPPGGIAIVFGDHTELQQVTLNLLLNAVDALKGRPDPRIGIELNRRGEDWILAIRDNGTGIPKEDQGRIFDMFFTTKDVGEGSGMGLAVVHTIVTNHGGRIELQSEAGQGSAFLIHLPAQRPVPSQAPSPS